ncbi:aminotransferase-like domain-containing protein [Streptococcus caprae]|uniref:PLP-dependent aminotransferase family protein n=1 Tax=Streptococcus caprae TaxID=1640501 RepID=A0ABV8CSS5_9STRE
MTRYLSKHEQIFLDLENDIQTGKLTKGDKLPSIRKLAETYACNKDTVQRALLELRHHNLIYVRNKSGYYVLGQDKAINDDWDFTRDLEPDKLSPYDDFQKCLNESLVGREAYLFNTSSTNQGLPQLSLSLQNLLADYHVYCKPADIVVTSGTQQALYILSQMTFPNHHQTILLEQPTYHRMNALVKSQNLPYETVTRTPQGLDMAELEQLFASQTIKFFYTIPRLHNPLGTSLSKAEKTKLLELAERYDVYIIEDDYMADFDSSHASPLHYFDQSDHVIYLKSFTTTIFPALRMAAAVLPTVLRQTFLDYKNLMDYDSNFIMQKALSLYLDNGMYKKHRDQLVKGHRDKIQDLQALLKKYSLATDVVLSDCKICLPANQVKKDHLKFYFEPDQLLRHAYITPNPLDYFQLNLNKKDKDALDQQLSRYFAKSRRTRLVKADQ